MPRKPSMSRINSQMRNLQSQARKAQRQIDSQASDLRRATLQARTAQNRASRELSAIQRPTVTYTPAENRYLHDVGQLAEDQAQKHPDRWDVFLCHGWDDRDGAARELNDLLESYGVSVWFSEDNIGLGGLLVRQIDEGLRNSHLGIVLITPALLRSLKAQGAAEQELSTLLGNSRVIPVVHNTTFDALREESPMLGARSGLSTEDSSLEDVAVKIANAVAPASA